MKTHLQKIIADVEKSKVNEFAMQYYNKCVLGRIYGIRPEESDIDVLEKYLGIIKFDSSKMYFSSNSKNLYTEEEWAVVRLFTISIGLYVTKNEWLAFAKEQLAKM